MAEVVSIKFRNRGKMYYFDPDGLSVKEGDLVVVETSKGLELGDVVKGNHEVDDGKVVQPLRPVARVATDDDRRIAALCRKREKEAYVVCKQKIAEHGLDMKLVDVECSFEGNKILFFFSSDGRVDFRELVKDLAGVFRTRIELRQIGVRDEARMLGGLGICGRAFCCGTFMDEFQPVSTKMAKTQSMSLNPSKISGTCGRLMCCLRYEQEAYEELVKNVPKNGAFVETPDGYGNVAQVNILRQTVRVKLDGPGEDTVKAYDADEVAAIPGGRPRDGSQPPRVLVLKPQKPKVPEEEESSPWIMPQMLPEEPAAEKASGETARPQKSGSSRRRSRGGKKPAGEKPAEAGAKAQVQPVKSGEGGPNRPKNSKNRSGKSRNGKPKTQAQPVKNPPARSQEPAKAQPGADAAPKAVGGENKPKKKNNNRRYYKKPKKDGGSAPKSE